MEKNTPTNCEKKKPSRAFINFTVDFIALLAMISLIGTGFVIRYTLPPGSGGRGWRHGLTLWGLDRHEWGDVHFWIAAILLGLLILHVALHWSWVVNFIRRRVTGVKNPAKLSARSAVAFGVGFLFLLNVLIVWFLWASRSSVFTDNVPEQANDLTLKEDFENRHFQSPAPANNHVDEPAFQPTQLHDKDHGETHRHENSRENRRSHRQGSGLGAGGEAKHQGRDGTSTSNYTVRGFMTISEVSQKTGVPVDVLISSLGLPKNVSAKERLGRLKRIYGFEIEDVRDTVEKYYGRDSI